MSKGAEGSTKQATFCKGDDAGGLCAKVRKIPKELR